MKCSRIILFCFLFLSGFLHAQEGGGDSLKTVEILPPTQRQSLKRLPDGTELQILAGTVAIKQGNTLFYCDSLVVNSLTKVAEAFGNVRIVDDTTRISSGYLRYLLDRRYAYLQKGVRLTDGQGVLTTPELEYDVNTKIAIYNKGGRLVNKKSVLTSRAGVYYSDTRDIFFKENVILKDPGYYLKTDSMFYNTETQQARFITDTYIRDSAGRVIRTREGSFVRGGQANFTQRTTIEDKCLRVTGDNIISDDVSGIVQIEGNAVLVDSCQNVIILGNRIFANKRTEAYLATRKPVMIIKQERDSIFVSADTLFTARLSDLVKTVDTSKKVSKPVKPTVAKGAKPDSTSRYFEAFRNVRIFSDSLQAVSDSLFYSFKDSTFRLYKDPVVWNGKSQITGDTIYLQTRNKKADRFWAFENSFVINEVQPNVYNQVRSSRMNGFLTEGNLDSLQAKGFAETVYYLQDNDSAFTGINQTASDAMDVYFAGGDLQRVVYRRAVKGTLWPLSQKRPEDLLLKGFQWLDKRRPKSKYELLE
jgi:lipopolysaccharide export system protein LptA